MQSMKSMKSRIQDCQAIHNLEASQGSHAERATVQIEHTKGNVLWRLNLSCDALAPDRVSLKMNVRGRRPRSNKQTQVPSRNNEMQSI